MSECPEFLIYQEGEYWRVVCTDGRIYEASGLYEEKENAIDAAERTGCPYRVIMGRVLNVLF